MVNALVLGGSGCGCYVFSLILELGTLVLKAGPKVLQKWGFYLIPTGTPLLRQPPPGPSGWCGAGPQADCSRLSAPRAGQHIPSCPGAHLIPARLRLLVPSLSRAWVRGGPKEACDSLLLVLFPTHLASTSPCIWGCKASCPDLLFPQTAA